MASEREWLPPTAARSSPVAAPRAEQSSLRNLTRLHRSTHTIRGEWKQFCSPHLFISSYSKVGVYAVFFLVEAQSYLPPSLPQGKQRGQRLSRALLPEKRFAGEPRRSDRRREAGPCRAAQPAAPQLREIYRLHETSFARGYDLVVVARSRAIGADYAALEHAYLSLAARLGLLTQNTP